MYNSLLYVIETSSKTVWGAINATFLRDISNNISANFKWDDQLWKNLVLDYFKVSVVKEDDEVVEEEFVNASLNVSIQENLWRTQFKTKTKFVRASRVYLSNTKEE